MSGDSSAMFGTCDLKQQQMMAEILDKSAVEFLTRSRLLLHQGYTGEHVHSKFYLDLLEGIRDALNGSSPQAVEGLRDIYTNKRRQNMPFVSLLIGYSLLLREDDLSSKDLAEAIFHLQEWENAFPEVIETKYWLFEACCRKGRLGDAYKHAKAYEPQLEKLLGSVGKRDQYFMTRMRAYYQLAAMQLKKLEETEEYREDAATAISYFESSAHLLRWAIDRSYRVRAVNHGADQFLDDRL